MLVPGTSQLLNLLLLSPFDILVSWHNYIIKRPFLCVFMHDIFTIVIIIIIIVVVIIIIIIIIRIL